AAVRACHNRSNLLLSRGRRPPVRTVVVWVPAGCGCASFWSLKFVFTTSTSASAAPLARRLPVRDCPLVRYPAGGCFMSWLRSLWSRNGRPPAPRTRPALEALEDRCLPATITEFPITNLYSPVQITNGPDGAFWFTAIGNDPSR